MKRPWYITLNDTGRSVGLAIKMTPFNFTTGKLNTDEVHTTYSQPDLHIDVPEISPNIYRLPGRYNTKIFQHYRILYIINYDKFNLKK